MASALPPIDLSTAVVGKQYPIDFTPFPKVDPAGIMNRQVADLPKAHIVFYNESGCGLSFKFNNSGNTHVLPAGGGDVFELSDNDNSVVATVSYIIPNAMVSLLSPVMLAPGEKIPTNFRGNSPIGIGGGTNTLSNEGSPAPVLVIDTGDNLFAQLFTLYNDGHSLWSVDQSGVKHQAIKIQTSGNPLQLGQAGDTSEVLGALLIDQTLTVTGDATFNGAVTSVAITNNETLSGTLGVTGASTLSGGLTSTGGAQTITANAKGSLHLGQTAQGDTIDTDGSGSLYLKAAGGATGVNIQSPSGTTIDTFTAALATLTQQLAITVAGTVYNGSVAGTATIWFPIWGSALKIFIVSLAGYNDATGHTFSFPSAIIRGLFWNGNFGASFNYNFVSGGVAQSEGIPSTFATATAPGTDLAVTNIFGDSWGHAGAADSIKLNSTAATVVNATIVFIGV